ncbi:MAG TPA: hypothetical protein VFK14_07590 [Solirubrobacterales bacterium]|nr:hypothetical protein [Solirubrobacterales bacterium]
MNSTSLPPRHRKFRAKPLLIAFGAATIAFDVALFVLDHHLEKTGGPSILGLEFAGSARRVEAIVSEWGAHGVHLARLSLSIDFGFMVSYGAFFTLAGLATRDFAREQGQRALAAAGRVAPWLAVAAALLDACENVIWLLALGGRAAELAPLATSCAIAKFALIAVAIAYAACGAIAWLWSLRTAGSR